MQDHPGAPGSTRPGNPGTAVPAACGGAAVQPLPQAPDHNRSSATPMPKVPGHIRPGAASMPKAPDLTTGPAPRPCRRRWATTGPALRPWRRQATLTLAVSRRSAGRSVPLTIAPVAGSCEPAAPGSLAPRRCHSPHSHLSASLSSQPSFPLSPLVIPAKAGIHVPP